MPTHDTIHKTQVNLAHAKPVLDQLFNKYRAATTDEERGRVVLLFHIFLVNMTRSDSSEIGNDDKPTPSRNRGSFLARLKEACRRAQTGKGTSDYMERLKIAQERRQQQQQQQPHESDIDRKKRRAEKQVKHGAFSKATSTMTSEGVAPGTDENFDITASKFPTPPQGDQDKYREELESAQVELGPCGPDWEPAQCINEESVQTAIDGLSNSTAADKTGVKAGHLKFVCWAGYTELLVLMLRDYLLERVSARVGDFLATGVLIPLWKNKEHTDIRPVTVPSLLARVVAKTINTKHGKSIGSTLAPLQIGVDGCKAIELVNVLLRARLEQHPDDCLLTFDMKNAYGSVSQTQILTALKQLQCPILLKYFLRTYSRPAQAIFRKSDGTVVTIENKTGVLQGDALSGLFFSLALQPALEKLRLKEGLRLVIAYLDDIVIICRKAEAEELLRGSFQKVLDDSQLRLEMNNAKTTVFSPLGDLDDAANWNCKVQPDGCTVLGTPIGSPEFIRQRLEVSLASFKQAISSILSLQTQSALLLLRYCVISRLNHLLRTIPATLTAATAHRANDEIWKAVKTLLDVPDETEARKLHFDLNRARTASTIPIALGGLGMTDPSHTLTGAFLAGIKDGLQQLQTSYPADFDWWMAFLRDTEQQPSTALDLKPYRESLRRSLNKVTNTFQTFSVTPFFASLRGPTGDDVTAAETDVMYPRTLDNLLLSGKGLQNRYAQMFHQVNL